MYPRNTHQGEDRDYAKPKREHKKSHRRHRVMSPSAPDELQGGTSFPALVQERVKMRKARHYSPDGTVSCSPVDSENTDNEDYRGFGVYRDSPTKPQKKPSRKATKAKKKRKRHHRDQELVPSFVPFYNERPISQAGSKHRDIEHRGVHVGCSTDNMLGFGAYNDPIAPRNFHEMPHHYGEASRDITRFNPLRKPNLLPPIKRDWRPENS